MTARWDDARKTVVDRFPDDFVARRTGPRKKHLPLVDRKLRLIVDEYEPLRGPARDLSPFTPRINGAKSGVLGSSVSTHREHEGGGDCSKRSGTCEPVAEGSIVDGEHDAEMVSAFQSSDRGDLPDVRLLNRWARIFCQREH